MLTYTYRERNFFSSARGMFELNDCKQGLKNERRRRWRLCFSVSAASYRGPGEDEDKDSYAARIAFTGNSRILGPICIVVGALMLALGVLLCMLTRRARRRERRVGFHCPLHGDFYPLSPVQGVKMLGESKLFFSVRASSIPFERSFPFSSILSILSTKVPIDTFVNPSPLTNFFFFYHPFNVGNNHSNGI